MITDILGDNIYEEEEMEQTIAVKPIEELETEENVTSPTNNDTDDNIIEETEKIENIPPVEVVSESATYTMEQAAKELGTSPASLRAFLNELGEDAIQIQRTLGGHRRLTYENIQQISRYYEIVHNNGMSVKQLKEVLNTQEGKILAKTNELEQLAELLTLFRSQTRSDLEEMAKLIASQVVDNSKLMIEQKNIEQEKAENMLKENIASVSTEVTEVEKRLGEKIESLSSLINALAEDNKKKDELIAELKHQNEKIIENTNKKKRWPFS